MLSHWKQHGSRSPGSRRTRRPRNASSRPGTAGPTTIQSANFRPVSGKHNTPAAWTPPGSRSGRMPHRPGSGQVPPCSQNLGGVGGGGDEKKQDVPLPRPLLSRQASITPTEAEVKDKWRQVGKCIIMVKSVASEFQKLEVTRRELEEQQNKIKHFLETRFDTEKLFDSSIYERPKDGIYFSRQLEEVSRNRTKRTKEQVRALRLTLRECSSLGAYPDYVQAELSRVGTLERYCSGRIVIREGHLASRIYFILSGTVVITKLNPDTLVDEALHILRKGDTFGETEVLEQTRRTTTVTSVTSVTLWSVDGQEFKNAMTLNITKQPMRSTDGSSGFNLPSTASLVLRNNPRTTTTTPRELHRSETAVSGVTEFKLQTAQAAIHRFLSNLPWFRNLNSMKFLQDTKLATLVYYANNKTIVSNSKTNDHLYFIRDGYCDVLTRVTITRASIKTPHYSTPPFDTGMTYEPSTTNGVAARKLRPLTGIIRRRGLPGTRRIDQLSRPKTAPHTHPTPPTSRHPRVTVEEPSGPKESTPPPMVTEFLKVCRLNPGDVYGMTSLFDTEELETALVSRGCEVVIVSKDSFSLLLNRTTREDLKSRVMLYPSTEEMEAKLRCHIGWNLYKAKHRTVK